MKRLVSLILVFALMLALAACGGSSGAPNTPPASNAPLSREDAPLQREDTSASGSGSDASGSVSFDSEALQEGKLPTDIIFSAQDEQYKQDLINDGKENGYEVSFGEDGSTTLTYEDGSSMKQNPDGSWVIAEESGEQASFGGSWPDNEYTKLIPKPEFGILGTEEEDGEFTVAFSNVSADDMKAYAEKVKAKGFDKDIDVQDQSVMGMTIYAFKASNADGYDVNVYYAADTGGVTVSK